MVSCPVDFATSQPWISTSMNRCPQYTDPGTGPYDTAHGASIAPGARNTAAATSDGVVVRAQRVVAEHVAVEPVADLLDGLPRAELLRPVVAGDDVVHELAHGPVVAVRRSAPTGRRATPATDRRVALERRACTSGRSTSIRSSWLDGRLSAGTAGPAAVARPASTAPSMKIHERRWIALGP